MSDHMARFLIALSQDPAGMEEFLKDPDLVLARTGLSPEEKEIVKSGDAARISRSLGLETAKGALYTATVSSQIKPPSPPKKTPRPPNKPTPPPSPPPKPGGSPKKKAGAKG